MLCWQTHSIFVVTELLWCIHRGFFSGARGFEMFAICKGVFMNRIVLWYFPKELALAVSNKHIFYTKNYY